MSRCAPSPGVCSITRVSSAPSDSKVCHLRHPPPLVPAWPPATPPPPREAGPPRLCSHLRAVAETSHFANQVAVNQHAVGGERAVHEGEAGQVLHGSGHAPLHGHQLQAAELALPLLGAGGGGTGQQKRGQESGLSTQTHWHPRARAIWNQNGLRMKAEDPRGSSRREQRDGAVSPEQLRTAHFPSPSLPPPAPPHHQPD